MLDVGFSELALIVVVTLIVLGPKEIPNVIRGLSRFLRQCREIIDECKAQLDGLAEESGIDETRKAITAEKKYIRDEFGELREIYDISDINAQRAANDTPKNEP